MDTSKGLKIEDDVEIPNEYRPLVKYLEHRLKENLGLSIGVKDIGNIATQLKMPREEVVEGLEYITTVSNLTNTRHEELPLYQIPEELKPKISFPSLRAKLGIRGKGKLPAGKYWSPELRRHVTIFPETLKEKFVTGAYAKKK